MLRMLLFVLLGIIVWRLLRLVTRIMQSSGTRGREHPFASYTPPRKSTDLKDIQDADFEDITEKRPPPTPPSGS